MSIDIVFPKNNEKEFIEMAQRLGYGSLCFVYDRPDTKKYSTRLHIYKGVLATVRTVGRFRNSDLVLVKSSGQDRLAVEKAKPDVIFSLEGSKKSDFIHQRNSGLNHIMCRLASQNNVAVGFSFDLLLGTRMRSRAMGRMMQNIRLCRKYKVRTVIASFASSPYRMRSPHDLESLFTTLGMHPKEAKESLSATQKIIRNNTRKKSKDYLGEGVEII